MNLDLSAEEKRELRELINSEGWRAAKKIYEVYMENYLYMLVSCEERQKADILRGQIKMLKSLENYLTLHIEGSRDEQEELNISQG